MEAIVAIAAELLAGSLALIGLRHFISLYPLNYIPKSWGSFGIAPRGLYKTFMNYLCLSYARQSSIEVVDNLSAKVAPLNKAWRSNTGEPFVPR